MSQRHMQTGSTALSLALAMATALAMTTPMAALAADAMRVVRDPATGELRAPNAAEAAAFDKAEAQLRARSGKPAAKAPVEIHYPDGTIETKLGDDTMMYSVVTAAEDGSLTMNCLPAKEADALVKSHQKSPAAKAGVKASTNTATNATANAAAKAGHAHD